MMRVISSLAIVGIMSAGASAATITLVDSTFDTGIDGWTGNDVSVVNTVSDPNADAIDANAIDGNTLKYTKSSYPYPNKKFTSTALDTVGEWITISADYRYDASVGNYVRFNLLNTADSSKGYSFSFNPSSGSTNTGELFEFGATGPENTRLGDRVATFDPAATVHNLSLTVTLTAPGTYTLTAVSDLINNVSHSITYVDTTPITTAFNQVELRLDNNANIGPAYLDNVKVTTAVPEPASLGLLAAGASMLLARRRRR